MMIVKHDISVLDNYLKNQYVLMFTVLTHTVNIKIRYYTLREHTGFCDYNIFSFVVSVSGFLWDSAHSTWSWCWHMILTHFVSLCDQDDAHFNTRGCQILNNNIQTTRAATMEAEKHQSGSTEKDSTRRRQHTLNSLNSVCSTHFKHV